MSFIGKNIKKIRAVKKMSQQDFATLFNLARPSVGAYEEGRAEPKIETVIQIAQYFKISVDTLLTKELTINELVKFDIFKKEFNKEEGLAVVNKDDIKEQTPLVTIDKMLEYIVNYQNNDFVNHLPVIQFPFTETKKSRAFQIQGSQMEYGNCGIHHKDILLCKPVDDFNQLLIDELYVLVTGEAIRARRISAIGNESITFKPDNHAYDIIEVPIVEIFELWHGIAVFSNNLKSPSRIEERVARLEEQIKSLIKS